jgi:hypothetical protein
MAPPHRMEAVQKEGRIALAVSAMQKKQLSSRRQAAAIYNAPESTMRSRQKGIPPRLGSRSKFRLLLEAEESVLLSWIYSMERRGFPPFLIDIRRMAQSLIDRRGSRVSKPVGKKWTYKFLSQHPELDKHLARSYDSQRAKNEDPKIISAWFELVRRTREKYGILDEETCNFDEIGFAMGLINLGASKVVTMASVGRATVIQPGNRKWVTTIECINAQGWILPPFIILEGKVHLEAWYRGNPDLPAGWAIALSDNGWTNDNLGFAWIQHFDKFTKDRTKGAYRLLILDSHGSHSTPPFDQFCLDNNIITLCMPSHSSHILQPLDVACFSPLKQAYSKQVAELVRNGIHHLDKTDFLANYQKARLAIHTEQNAISGFRATGLIPFNPERVLSALTITKTPSPPASVSGQLSSPWTSETPKNVVQTEKQMQLVRTACERRSQSPTEYMAKVAKGAQMAWSVVALQAQEMAKMAATIKDLQGKKKLTKKQLQNGDILYAENARELLAARDNAAEQHEIQRAQQGSRRAPPTCSRCGTKGHNKRYCTVVQDTS